MVAFTCKPSIAEEMDRYLGLPSQSAWPPWRASGGPQLRNDTQGYPPAFTCTHTQQVLETHTHTRTHKACTCTTRNTHSKIHCLGFPGWSIKKKLLDQCTQSYHPRLQSWCRTAPSLPPPNTLARALCNSVTLSSWWPAIWLLFL